MYKIFIEQCSSTGCAEHIGNGKGGLLQQYKKRYESEH